MTFIPGQSVRFEDVDYVVREVEESFGDSELPGVPRVNTIATLDAADGSHQIAVEVLNSDNIKIVEEAL